MAPGSCCMRGNTCSCRMSWTYRWAVVVPRIYTRGDRVFLAMAPHTITSAVGAVCRCNAEAGLRRSPRGLHHTKTIVITSEIDFGFGAKCDDVVPYRCSSVSSCTAPLQTEASIGGRQG
ncbi:uncharacterized protein TNCV_4932751 [Trichonephila clavipes]|nr:uncharacterized protein TNCV_4932751 [Trichonephila clavipes]